VAAWIYRVEYSKDAAGESGYGTPERNRTDMLRFAGSRAPWGSPHLADRPYTDSACETWESSVMLVHLRGPADWPLWRAARLAALTDAPDAFPGAAAEWPEGGESRWRERLLDPSALKIVAVHQEAPVGLVRGVLGGGSAWLHSLWVSQRLRGHGLGDQLVEAVEDWAREQAAHVRLEVVPANAPAIRLYRRRGYIETSMRGGPLPGGGHELVMEKALGSPVPDAGNKSATD
jgi:ribosomal protein S18 acetylase RimI-like enzyme